MWVIILQVTLFCLWCFFLFGFLSMSAEDDEEKIQPRKGMVEHYKCWDCDNDAIFKSAYIRVRCPFCDGTMFRLAKTGFMYGEY